MFFKDFILNNFKEIKKGGIKIFYSKILTSLMILTNLCLIVFYLPLILIVYLISPFFLIRFSPLNSSRIGHFTSTTELYCCERDAKINQSSRKFLDIFYLNGISNKQLVKMWKREIKIFPKFFISPIFFINKFLCTFFHFPKKHDIIMNSVSLSNEHDIYNLLEQLNPHLSFTPQEEEEGKKYLKSIGIKNNEKFICLITRDQKYLKTSFPLNDFSYHQYRNININKFKLTAENLANRGYYVIRMGKIVETSFDTKNPKIIDYANSRERNDFLDIYLGAKCFFCISSQTGYDQIPSMFRKPLVYIAAPIGIFFTHCKNSLVITKHYFSEKKKRNLKLTEIVGSEIARTFHYFDLKKKNIKILEPTEEDINDVSLEMLDRLEGTWVENQDDLRRQKKFWKIYSSSKFTNERSTKRYRTIKELNFDEKKLHGEIKIKYGTKFLRKNSDWLN